MVRRGDEMMVEWPGRCYRCRGVIDDWSDAGLFQRRWIHKACFNQNLVEANEKGVELPLLRSPIDRVSVLELPMLIFLLLFHFGLGGAVVGWILITQGSEQAGIIVLVIGLVTPLIGVVGAALNILSRRRIELIRQTLDLQGGWKPGR
jgi:hypothetical protein